MEKLIAQPEPAAQLCRGLRYKTRPAWRANAPLTSANVASCRIDNNVIPGPFDTVNSKSPVLEKRTSASPISVVLGLRYMSWPVLVSHPAVGLENSWDEVVVQLVTQTTAIKIAITDLIPML